MKQNQSLNVPTELQALFDELCVELGFCLPPSDIQRISSLNHLNADQFVEEIFNAEGMSPDLYLARQIRRKFIDRFGNGY